VIPIQATEVLDELETFFGQIHCGVQQAGLDSLIQADLSFSQFRSLLILTRTAEPMPIHELAESLRLSVGATGRNVEQLVKVGLVDRQEDEIDRRIKRISLTGSGRDLITGFKAQQRKHALEFVEALDEADRERLLAALRPINERSAAAPPSNPVHQQPRPVQELPA
jgi:MarR family 2-MHQ and catechol resistance regulon transcriptional repressor